MAEREDKPFAVMVTGGAGYIGSHAVLALGDAGWPVVVLDNLATGFRWAVDPRAMFVEADVADAAAVRQAITGHRVGAILHFAGSLLVAESVVDPLKYYRNNVAATRVLLAAALAEGVRHVVFSSTAATYGVPEAVPVAESAPTRPINPYGSSKLAVEWMLRDVAAAHPLNFAALRYFNVAGADPAGRSGQSVKGATHLIHVAVEAATGRRDHVAVYGDDYPTPDGTCIRDYIHVTDLAAAHVHALDWLIAHPDESRIMNCGYGRGFSVREVLDEVDRVLGHRLDRRLAPRRPGDPDRLVADASLLRRTTGWRPRHDDIASIIGHALAWERALQRRDAGGSSADHPVS